MTDQEQLRVLIADDDAGMRTVMRKIIAKVEGFTLVAEAGDGKITLELTEQLKPNVVFLDVEMPQMSGVECARAIQDMDPSIVIIFATAHDTYMGDAFEVYAFDYLVKPFKEGVNFINQSDILLVQREDRATVLYTADGGRYVTGDSLAEMEERLHSDAFFRCHKSYIINLNHIKDITPYGRWTYVVRLENTKHDALITHEKYEELERMFR